MVESMQRVPFTQIETLNTALIENQKRVQELIELKEKGTLDVSEVESNFRNPLVQIYEIVSQIIDDNSII